MRNNNKVVFCTADQLEELADAFAGEAKRLPAGQVKEEALRQAAKLRVYATMKRALTPQAARAKQ